MPNFWTLSKSFDLQFLNDGSHLSVVGHLSLFVAVHFDAVDTEAAPMPPKEARDHNTGPHLRLEVPLDFEHAPVSLDSNRCQSFLLPMLFRFAVFHKQTRSVNKSTVQR